ncbi:uncharacterized protein LOC142260631 [Anomaloglossus baeobatrachus]|uniref:uncharacterized protein LOC142260631 n=1 Tax=Anomaloglossus baeobatrachus TaxID=238106 RepID=UPI003F4FA082
MGVDRRTLTPGQQKLLEDTLWEYQEAFSRNDEDFGCTSAIEHEIPTGDAAPIRERYRQIPPKMYQEVKDMVASMLENRVIQESQSPWAAPVVLVRKKDGSLRFCVDYRKLNAQTVREAYPLPRIEESLSALGHAKFFSTLDLASGYWQVPVAEKDKAKTAFILPMGLYEFNRMPFGLSNAPGTFQRLMEHCLGDLNFESVLIYLDDVIVFGTSFKDHLQKLRQVLGRLRDHGLKIKPRKCQLFQHRIEYLGHVVTTEGVQPAASKVEPVQKWPRPNTLREVRAFLGLAGYYRRFIPKFAHLAGPINELLRGTAGGPKTRPIEWGPRQQEAFEALKKALTSAPILAYARFDALFLLYTDGSLHGLGAVLSQMQDGRERVIAYGSRSLRESERNPDNYSSFKLELLALVWAMTETFAEYLTGAEVTVMTDNNPLAHLGNAKLGALEQRWMARLSKYQYHIQFRSGRENSNADALYSELTIPGNTLLAEVYVLDGEILRRRDFTLQPDRRSAWTYAVGVQQRATPTAEWNGQVIISLMGVDRRTLTPGQQKLLEDTLWEYQEAFSRNDEDFGCTSAIEHEIPTGDAAPIRERYRQIPPKMYQEVKDMVASMLENRVIQESQSPWAAPVVLVRKKDGSLRFCVDYRKLNAQTVREAYPLPRIEESLSALVFGTSCKDHLQKLRQVLGRLRDHGLKIKPRKCQLFQHRIEYLGHVVTTEGVQPAASKVEAVQKWPRPNTLREVRAFLGLAGYYRRFIPKFAHLAGPINELLRGTAGGPKTRPIEWGPCQQEAFEALKKALTSAPILAYARFDAPFLLYTDGSLHGLGAVLSQMQDGRERVIAYGSRSLRESERNPDNYSSFKLELLALVWAMTEKFAEYLTGAEVTVMTDNNPLAHLGNAKLGALEQRWMGACFQGTLMTELYQLYGIERSRTTPYHPQGNGACERFNRTLLQMLRTLEDSQKARWPEYLPKLMWAYNNRVHSTTGYSPHMLMFGRAGREIEDLHMPNPMQPPPTNTTAWAQEHRRRLRAVHKVVGERLKQVVHPNPRPVQKDEYAPGDRVMVKAKKPTGKLDGRWEAIPYVVKRRVDPAIPV